MLRLGASRAARFSAVRMPQASLCIPKASMMAPLGIRFNSTATQEIKTKLTDFASESAAAIDTATTTTLHSDQIGYLQSIGLGTGWGPTSMIENVLEMTHVYTGLPWWATIVASTVIIRTLMVPIYIKSSANMAKMSKVKPQLDVLMDEIRNGDNEDKMLAMRKRSKLFKEYGIKTSHSFLPILQVPVAYGFFQATRKMAEAPVEGFSTQGAFWFEDLTAVDPYLGLQIFTALVVTGMMRMGGETGAQAMNPMLKKVMTWLPFASILITQSMSSAVVLYFAANAVFSLIQTTVLKNKHFRKLAKLPPIETPVPVPGAKAPPATLSEWWKDFNDKMKNQTHNKMSKTNKQLEAMERRRGAANDGFIKRH